jgi:hypothetical protein
MTIFENKLKTKRKQVYSNVPFSVSAMLENFEFLWIFWKFINFELQKKKILYNFEIFWKFHKFSQVCIYSLFQEPEVYKYKFIQGICLLLGLIKPVLSHHAVVSGLDQLYSYDHNEKIRKIL